MWRGELYRRRLPDGFLMIDLRKTLRAALSGLAGSGAAAEAALVAAGVDPTARGEVLAVADFARIAEHLEVV